MARLLPVPSTWIASQACTPGRGVEGSQTSRSSLTFWTLRPIRTHPPASLNGHHALIILAAWLRASTGPMRNVPATAVTERHFKFTSVECPLHCAVISSLEIEIRSLRISCTEFPRSARAIIPRTQSLAEGSGRALHLKAPRLSKVARSPCAHS